MKPLSMFDKLSFGVGDVASNFVFTAVSTYLMFFYTDVFGISAAIVGTILFVTRMWDAISDPIMGMISDRTQSRWGQFRPYLLFVPIPLAIIAVLTFTTPDISDSGKVIWAFATYILLMTLYTAINIPYSSMLTVMSDSPTERGQMSAYRMMLAFSGALLVNAGTLPLVEFFGAGDQQKGFQLTMALFSIIMVLLFWFCFIRVKERVAKVEQPHSLKEDFKVVVKNRAWWITILAGVPIFTFTITPFVVGMYYFKYYIGDTSAASLFFTFGTVGLIFGAFLCNLLVKRICKRKLMIGGVLGSALCISQFYWIGADQITLIYVLIFLNQACKSIASSCVWAVVADTADYIEWKSKRRVVGLATSSATFSHKFGMGLGGMLVGFGLSYAGYEADAVQTPETIEMIKLFMSFVPAFGACLIAVIMLFYPVTKSVAHTMQQELRVIRAQPLA